MTLISQFNIKGIPVLIADTLTSIKSDKNIDPIIPSALTPNKRLELKGEKKIWGQSQKTMILGNKIAIGFAGNGGQAKDIAKTLESIVGRSDLNLSLVEKTINSMETNRRDKVAYIGVAVVQNGDKYDYIPFSHRARKEHLDYLGDVSVIGRGSQTFLDRLKRGSSLLTQLLINSTDDNVVRQDFCVKLTGGFIGQEYFWGGDLAKFWGGGFEIIKFNNGMIEKIGNIVHLFWNVRALPDGSYAMKMRKRFMKHQYVKEKLVFRVKELEDDDMEGDRILFFAPLNSVNPKITYKDALSVNWESDFVCSHVGIVPPGTKPRLVLTEVMRKEQALTGSVFEFNQNDNKIDIEVYSGHIIDLLDKVSKVINRPVKYIE